MLRQFQYKSTVDYDKAVQEAVGLDKDNFERKREHLFKRWCEASLFPSVESGIVLRIVGKQLPPAPLDCALLIDNLDFFSSNYKNVYEEKPELALKIACICGAKKIALFLLDKMETNFTNPKMHYLLEYIMTSDIEWAKEVAHGLISAGQKDMPQGISTFPTVEEYSKIQDLFINNDMGLKAEMDEKKEVAERKQNSLNGKLGNK